MADLCESAGKDTGWIRFQGVLYILAGILEALTCVGILFAWLPIWLGTLLLRAASAGEQAARSRDETRVLEYHDRLQLYFKIQGIVILVSLILTVGVTVIVFLLYGAAVLQWAVTQW